MLTHVGRYRVSHVAPTTGPSVQSDSPNIVTHHSKTVPTVDTPDTPDSLTLRPCLQLGSSSRPGSGAEVGVARGRGGRGRGDGRSVGRGLRVSSLHTAQPSAAVDHAGHTAAGHFAALRWGWGWGRPADGGGRIDRLVSQQASIGGRQVATCQPIKGWWNVALADRTGVDNDLMSFRWGLWWVLPTALS